MATKTTRRQTDQSAPPPRSPLHRPARCARRNKLGPHRVCAANSAAFGDNSTLGVSRVIFINGDNDPFSWGSVTVNSSAALEHDVVALVARAGSHCADMGASSDRDTPSMAAVKRAKAHYFAKWATEPAGLF